LLRRPHFSVDFWSDKHNSRSFGTVIFSSLNAAFERSNYCLGAVRLRKDHNADNIMEWVNDIFKKFDLGCSPNVPVLVLESGSGGGSSSSLPLLLGVIFGVLFLIIIVGVIVGVVFRQRFKLMFRLLFLPRADNWVKDTPHASRSNSMKDLSKERVHPSQREA